MTISRPDPVQSTLTPSGRPQRLALQEKDAIEWRDACLLYFQQFSKRPLPDGVEPPAYDLQHYIDVDRRFYPGHPGDY